MDAVSSLYEAQNQNNTELNVQNPGGTLGKNEFMKMLITQMQNQDPMKPMNNTEMTAQLAQFSALEQMENLNNQFLSYQQNSTAAFSLMNAGSTVEMELTKGGDPVVGVLDKIQWDNGQSQFVINGDAYSVGDIRSMRVLPTPTTATEPYVEGDLPLGPEVNPEIQS